MTTAAPATTGKRDGTSVVGRPGPARSRHFLHFDSMRAVAVFCVLLLHVGAASGTNWTAWYGVAISQGRIGVWIFFLISAFLLYRPYAVAQLRDESAPALGTYVRRRILRIIPAYWTALTLLAIWPGLKGVWSRDWWVYYGMLQAYWPATLASGIAVAWSLTTEVAFYVVLPLLAAFLAWLGRGGSPRVRMVRALWALALLAVGAEVFRISIFAAARNDLKLNPVSMFLPFAVGMGLATASAWLGTDETRWRWSRFVVRRPGACWCAAVAVFVTFCFTPVFKRTFVEKHSLLTWTIEQPVYVVIAALLLLPAIFGETAGGWPRRLLATRALAYAGMVSYGIFLWHQPLVRWMHEAHWDRWGPGYPFLTLLVLALTVSLLLATASYRLVELPAMRLRGEPPKRIR